MNTTQSAISIFIKALGFALILVLMCPMITQHFDGAIDDMELCEESGNEKESEKLESEDDKVLNSSPDLTSPASEAYHTAHRFQLALTSGPYRDIHSPPPDSI